MSERPVACLPPPLPPKTKSKKTVTLGTSEEIDQIVGHRRTVEEDRISAPYTVGDRQFVHTAAVSTVHFGTVAATNIADKRSEESVSVASKNVESRGHVVKILINPQETRLVNEDQQDGGGKSVSCDANQGDTCIRISVNNTDTYQNNTMVDAVGRSSPSQYFFNQFLPSGQMSPSDTLDSGTCSDLDGTPPPLPKKKGNGGVSVTLIGSHKSASGLGELDSDDNESQSSGSSISCDSLNCGKSSPIITKSPLHTPKSKSSIIPQTLLQDIRQRKDLCVPNLVDEKSYEERQQESDNQALIKQFEELNSDMFFDFHLNEKNSEKDAVSNRSVIEDETFAGFKDLINGSNASTIRSSKGTVRGVKNRVRAGIATFLQINSSGRSYKEKDAGKVVVYTTSMGIIRETYHACMKVKQILRTLLVKFEERDVFMSTEYQNEIKDRMRCDHILIPQVYVDGQHCGDAETIERLNESGELRKILKVYKNPDVCTTCQSCGGYRLLPCSICNGSKKSVHRNHFTAEFVALKCMNCDENGLVKCSTCS
ncbi:glutaredoxin domain-containing cysteine-rich protein CG12206-like [Rhynchophorus ferrugineus]|uniref:glutaredoxin domain-containing cysteine-rich protein CG12206-like n=1 Tax=Rhynchophorus ferrugineus TaxID=354439 RepID=UPI003FCEB94C